MEGKGDIMWLWVGDVIADWIGSEVIDVYCEGFAVKDLEKIYMVSNKN